MFNSPVEAKQSKKKYPTITYEYAQEEIASKNGLKMDNTANNGTMTVNLQTSKFHTSADSWLNCMCWLVRSITHSEP